MREQKNYIRNKFLSSAYTVFHEVYSMKCLKRAARIGVLFVLITGSLSHFLYDWTGRNAVVGLFVPVNESVWEHMKLLFFPMLLYSLFVIFRYRVEYPCITSSMCFGILVGTFLIPVFFYAYTRVLGRDLFLLDIGTFLFSILIAFLLSYRLTLSCRLRPYTFLLCILTAVLFVCFVWFTCYPPPFKIFEIPGCTVKLRQTYFQSYSFR